MFNLRGLNVWNIMIKVSNLHLMSVSSYIYITLALTSRLPTNDESLHRYIHVHTCIFSQIRLSVMEEFNLVCFILYWCAGKDVLHVDATQVALKLHNFHCSIIEFGSLLERPDKCGKYCKNYTFYTMLYYCDWHFYAPGSNDGGHIVFVLSVCLLSTLTFALTFEP